MADIGGAVGVIGSKSLAYRNSDKLLQQKARLRQLQRPNSRLLVGLGLRRRESDAKPTFGSWHRSFRCLSCFDGALCWVGPFAFTGPAEESEASGIADQDGLDEQVPFRDWQMVGMV